METVKIKLSIYLSSGEAGILWESATVTLAGDICESGKDSYHSLREAWLEISLKVVSWFPRAGACRTRSQPPAAAAYPTCPTPTAPYFPPVYHFLPLTFPPHLLLDRNTKQNAFPTEIAPQVKSR